MPRIGIARIYIKENGSRYSRLVQFPSQMGAEGLCGGVMWMGVPALHRYRREEEVLLSDLVAKTARGTRGRDDWQAIKKARGDTLANCSEVGSSIPSFAQGPFQGHFSYFLRTVALKADEVSDAPHLRDLQRCP